MNPPGALRTLVAEGRYAIFHAGEECGEERWRIEADADGIVATGIQETVPPHPFPTRQEYRATLSPEWRLTGLEIVWTVGPHELRARHAADGPMWRVRIEHGERVREQEGDFPEYCEVEYGTLLFNRFILARRDFAIGGEHEYPVLRIGPPFMAVMPDRQLMRCVERAVRHTPWGDVPAKRYTLTVAGRPSAEGYSFWADENDVVLESYEDLESGRTWMKLVEYRRGE